MKIKNKKRCISEKLNRIILLLGFVFLLNSGFSATVDSSELSQELTIELVNKPINDILEHIEEKSGYVFLYSEDVLNEFQNKTLNVKNRSIVYVLDKLFANMPINYDINNRQVTLSKVKRVVKTTSVDKTVEQSRIVKGLVTTVDGAPVIGANVLLKGTNAGTTTGIDGSFSLKVSGSQSVLSISYLGYITKEITVGTADKVTVSLVEDALMLSDVVVTALGIERSEKALSYNVQQIASEDFNVVKGGNFMNSLQGKVAGVSIQNSAGGIGGSSRVVMRGVKSITKDNNALYVIDGIPMFNTNLGSGDSAFSVQGSSDAVADLNSDDIESINFLTGPSAAALYGSQAANGVVLINTRKGTVDKTTLTISNNTMFSTAYMMPEMQNTYGNTPGEFASWGAKTSNNYDPSSFFNTGVNIINAASFSTGTDRNQTYASLSSTNGYGIIPNNTYDRINFTIRNTSTFLNDKLSLDLSANYIAQSDLNMTTQGQYFNPLPSLYLFPRGESFDDVRMYQRYNEGYDANLQFWPYGDQGLSLQNPYWITENMNRETNKDRYMIAANLSYKITDWINISGRVKMDNSTIHQTRKEFASTLRAGANGFYQEVRSGDNQIYADVLVNINKTFGDFTLSANIGSSIEDSQYERFGVEGDLASIPNEFTIRNINLSSRYKSLQEGYRDQVQSVFASVELGWKSMVYLAVTGRNEWDSALAFTENSSFFYPSIGLSGILTEAFNLPEFISFAKVRGSYSQVTSAFDRYLSNPAQSYNEVTRSWSGSTSLPLKNYQPEMTSSWEFGLNATLWRKLNIDLTYYKSNTLDQLFNIGLAASSGYSSIYVQSGDIENSGIELAIGYSNTWDKFSWSTNYVFSMNNNKVKKLASGSVNDFTGEIIQMDELEMATLGFAGYGPRVILREGGTMGDIYVDKELKTDGSGQIWVDSQTGQLGVQDYEEPRKLGSLHADYTMGLTNSFAYKGFNLGVLISASIGGLAVSNTQGILDYYGVSQASADARDAGGVPINNGVVSAQVYYQTIGGSTGGLGQYYVYDATNVRLGELSLTYDFPRSWFRDKLGLTAGVVAKNLLMIYCKAPFDPGMTSSTSNHFYQGVDYFMQPSTRNIGFNIKLQF